MTFNDARVPKPCQCCRLVETTRFYGHRRVCSVCAELCPIGGPCSVMAMVEQRSFDVFRWARFRWVADVEDLRDK